MLSYSVRATLIALLTAPALAAPRPDPADAAASAPKLGHRSALADYKRHADAPPADWKAANQLVERIGGWRAYAREVAQSASPREVTQSASPREAALPAPEAPTAPAAPSAPSTTTAPARGAASAPTHRH